MRIRTNAGRFLTTSLMMGVVGWISAASLAQTPGGSPPTGGVLPIPSPTLPPQPSTPTNAPVGATSSREAALEDRIRQLEATVDRLSQMMTQQAEAAAAPVAAPTAPAAAPAAPKPTPPNAPGQSVIPIPAANARFNSPAPVENKPAKVKFGPGFEIRSEDDEFIFQFHNITQFEYRGYQQGGQNPVHDTFDIPRQWFMFSGRITKPIGYFVSIANGFDNLSILDVFTDLTIDPKLQVRLGRFKTPFTYEFLIEPVQGLAIPERSIFFNNFGQNRDVGVMAFGKLFDSTVDYSVGVFNGSRNGFVANQDGKGISALVNYKPFVHDEGSLLENLNIGGSVYAINHNQVPQPAILRTIVPTTGNAVVGVPFLAFNSDVREIGDAALWDLHIAYFYKQLAVVAEWGSGYQSYARTSAPTRHTPLDISSFYTQASYFLTGETRSSIATVKPLHPFNLKNGEFGLGAFEPFVRYEYLNLSNDVFTQRLANPAIWTNDVQMTWVGMNWHLNQYLKMYFGWNHAEFGNPVQFAPGRTHTNSDMFLARVQLFF